MLAVMRDENESPILFESMRSEIFQKIGMKSFDYHHDLPAAFSAHTARSFSHSSHCPEVSSASRGIVSSCDPAGRPYR